MSISLTKEDNSTRITLTKSQPAASTYDDTAIQAEVDANTAITGKAVVSDITGITGAGVVTNIVTISQANYDAIVTPHQTTHYIIV